MTNQEQLEAFIGRTFRSVWALEILRFLSDNDGRSFRGEDLISTLHLSQAVVKRSIIDLMAAGLVTVDERGLIAFGTDHQSEFVNAAIDLYVRSPNKVRRVIVAQQM
ncbi:MarR family transcriptional regulator [Altererythrobacter sp. Root672]|uniref:MarR family transcriptional regulator n=1 Tax=Altererythrobacter sp. Root672 TaxID=1736584 RepID=UPI000700DA90|nr:MarR family transcriptional regulator [Altererythrobacter sp. Root672]KRA79723.1 hypothetical protein ASD76_17020 [Altererythrobacter sp. Root672]